MKSLFSRRLFFRRLFVLQLLFLPLFFFSGCASYKLKKECEATNWHQYGHDLAMQGRRVSGDQKVEQCRKVERISDSQLDIGFKVGMNTYCKPEIVYSTGRNGDFFNTEMCDAGSISSLKNRHQQGVKEYCAVKNGFAAGAKGRAYNNICPAEMEAAFLPEFKRGRKKYLGTMITENNARILDLERQQMGLEREMLSFSYQLNALPQPQRVEERRYNEITKQTDVSTRYEDPFQFQRSQLQGRVSDTQYKINQMKLQQDALKNQTHEFNRELSTMDLPAE